MGREDDETTDRKELISSSHDALVKRSHSLAIRGLRDLEAAEKAQALLSTPLAQLQSQGARILVVDNDFEVRETVWAMLTSAGYRCKAVSGGLEAFALFDSGEEFDLLTTDLLNTPMDGLTLLERARQRFPNVPVVVATAINDAAVSEAAMRAGAYEYLVKPFTRDSLLEIIGRALGAGSSRPNEDVPMAEQFKIGAMYCKGRDGFPQDYEEALRWYRLAAGRGYAPAQNSIGVMYDYGLGVPHNYGEAMKWYRLAATQGYVNAQANLGKMYHYAMGVYKDFTEAAKWYRLAADQGDADSQANLKQIMARGST